MKLQKNSIRKIDISQINKTDNIRKQYDDIEQLARSIERDGQLQPIGVTEQENGTFNILYGFRRYHAFLFLIDEGKPFNQIEAKITTGDPAIIQLIENIHRDDLKPEEFENALQALIDKGMSQTEISERLNIRITRISDVLAARKERFKLQEKGVDTSDISTSAISQVRSLPEEKKAEVIEKSKEKGATVKAIKEEVQKAKQEKKENVEDVKIADNKDSSMENNLYEIDNDGCEIVDDNEEAYIFISFTDFLDLPEVKEIINKNNYMLQDKCQYCGENVR